MCALLRHAGPCESRAVTRRVRVLVLLPAAAALAVACSGGDASDPAGSGGAAATSGDGDAATHADAGATGTGDDFCTSQARTDFGVATTYYVAMQEPGASNDACDGLAPSDMGGGHCPFRDFGSPRTANLL